MKKCRWQIRRHQKYNAAPTVVDGFRFDSKREATYYSELKLKVRAGEVVYFLRQVPFHLPGPSVYRVDFLEFHSDGTIHYIDVKGMLTPEFKLKKKIVESLYPVEIEVVK